MYQRLVCSNTDTNKTINPKQLAQIIEAIIEGKYSWACVLFLRCIGENPLHYIPYRTHNRLVKENSRVSTSRQETSNINLGNQSSKTTVDNASSRNLSQITDLAYLEMVDKQHSSVHGGDLDQLLNREIKQDNHSSKLSNFNTEIKNFGLGMISFFKNYRKHTHFKD